MVRKFTVRQVLFEVESHGKTDNGRDLSKLTMLAVGNQLQEGEIVQSFRMQVWQPIRVGNRQIEAKEYHDGMLIGQDILGERKL